MAQPRLQARSKYALAIRHHGTESPQAAKAKQQLDAENARSYVDKVVAAAPALTDEQRNRLAQILASA